MIVSSVADAIIDVSDGEGGPVLLDSLAEAPGVAIFHASSTI